MQPFKYPFAMPLNYQYPGAPAIHPQATTPQNITQDLIVKQKARTVPTLFKPITIRNQTLKNRVVASPMCQYCSVDGFMSDWHLVHYGTFAKGGVSMIVFEATAVLPEGRITPQDSGLWKDEQIEPLKRIVDFVHQFNTLASIQIGHAGRRASTIPLYLDNAKHYIGEEQGGWSQIDAPSPLLYGPEMIVPHELSVFEIESIVQSFKDTAIRVEKAGFDALEIHGAHGYLINSFLSPLSNRRTDEYGVDFEGRIKILTDIVKAIRTVWSKILMVRISAEEWIEGGWTLDDSIQLTKILKELDVDILDASSGGNSADAKIPFGPLFQVPLAEGIKREVPDIITSTVGSIKTVEQAMSIIDDDRADLVMLGRPLLRDPFWVLHSAASIKLDLDQALQYNLGKDYR
ncbi:hypothetical protein PPL_00275 [Heterostelium album PN500]|uniref:NADH:flavin oxidoreductase/NADH oxidase N-terminal domain-containing protein n=1 Tax=Heterostelium pallidum (strain ATCC 26659 / Pp 5 / PN500) TaxID=670386 RepID=D3AW08_HETP5|nr:hypothetical protein PPL_00275 [Heterostelium album PN500]EFA86481.1 hypothetical protein PPL_00275 [Heterostelium album PN500]|eukprot:XP_020438586.1 hypothetical protein PPL_00275 [Heterostelium album PN500]